LTTSDYLPVYAKPDSRGLINSSYNTVIENALNGIAAVVTSSVCCVSTMLPCLKFSVVEWLYVVSFCEHESYDLK